MEPVKDAERQSNSLDDGPGQKAVKFQLDRIRLDFLCLKRIDDPHCDIADQQEGDHLSSGFGAIVFRKVDTATRDICYEQQLQHHLHTERKVTIFFPSYQQIGK